MCIVANGCDREGEAEVPERASEVAGDFEAAPSRPSIKFSIVSATQSAWRGQDRCNGAHPSSAGVPGHVRPNRYVLDMATKPVPITPSVLAWAMAESAVGVDDLAKHCSVDRVVVEKWLAGDESPGTSMFRRIAKHLSRPTSLFFLDSAPEREVPPAFRRPAGAEVADLSREEAKAVRAARRTQLVLAGIRQRLEDEPETLPHSRQAASPESEATRARSLLRWSIHDQLDASSKSAATKALRSRLEQVGVVVLHFSMGDRGHRGFSLFDDWAPVIAANTNYNAEARSFTYAHELGHLFRRSDSFCGLDSDAGLERWCEEFAAAFLLPAVAVRAFVKERFGGTVATLDQIKRTANHFKVSQSAVAIRLSDLDLGPGHLYSLVDRNKDYAKSQGGPATGGLTTPELRLLSLGRLFPETLLAGEQAGVIRHHDVLNYLDVTSSQLVSVRGLLTSELSAED